LAAVAMVAIPKNIKKQTTTTKTDSLKMARPFKFSKFKFAGELNLSQIYQI